MASAANLLTTEQVSDLLGVEGRYVRVLAEAGLITRVTRGAFDRTSVERYRLQRVRSRTRTWAEHTAWGAIAVLSGAAPLGLGDTQRHRLRAALRDMSDPTELTMRLRDRANVTTWSGHRSAVDRIRQELVTPDRTRLDLTDDQTIVDGYLAADQTVELVHRYHLREDPAGQIALRSTGLDIKFVAYLSKLSRTLAAVDAATSLDPRERGVGERVLARRLELFHENSSR